MRLLLILVFISICMQPLSSQQQESFDFEGIKWHRRVTNQNQGPGNNLFGIKPQSVYLDKKGRLNLKIKKAGQNYSCAEGKHPANYTIGCYKFFVSVLF